MTEKKKGGFLKGVRAEFKKVHWPTKADTIQFTITVLVIAGIVALLSYGLDVLFSWVISLVR